MGKSLADLTAEIREINVAHGWRPAEGGPGDNTFGDYIALLHSEVSEALEAFRDHRLADATGPGAFHARDNVRILPKPEGVGSELADVLIRLLDMCDVFGLTLFDMDCELADVELVRPPGHAVSFGDYLTWLHNCISAVPARRDLISPIAAFPALPFLLRAVVTVAERYGIDLTAEVERKVAYNRTREFQHGGRTLAGAKDDMPWESDPVDRHNPVGEH
jgi:NTP pyrophosphatase (non-canonical NTP hydrolase)